MLKHHLNTLSNGLKVLRIPMPSVKSVTVLVLVNTGSRYEEPHEFGIAHFLEHMVFKGTAKYETAQALAEAVDAVGADFNAFTSKEYTGYYVKSDSQHMSLALDVISDMLLTPRLNAEDLEREKQVIVEEMNMYRDTPARHIADIFEDMMFAGSGLGHDVVGTKEAVTNLQVADFQKYLRQWYGLGNMVVVVAGDAEVVEETKILSQIETFFTKGDQDRAQDKVKLQRYLSANPLSVERLLVEFKQTEQAHFILAFPGIDRKSESRYPLMVLSTILGGNMSSRLFSEIREKRGLCYYVHSDADIYHDTGIFGASAGVDPSRIEEAIEATMAEFKKIKDRTNPVTATELQKAKDYLAGKLTLGLEDSESVAQYFGMRQLLMGKIDEPEEYTRKIRAVTLEQVQAIAEQLIQPDQVRFAVIGPYKEAEKFKKVLAL
jgi:predicted Zn-dependent peptidase